MFIVPIQVFSNNRTGLGELTFLQLSTIYAPPSVAGHSVGSVGASNTSFVR